jgi:hypothetical protein
VRRSGCLPALFSVLFYAAVIAVLAWFGFQAYQHIMDYRAMAERNDAVASAWADPTTLAKAATGDGGVLPPGLSAQPFQQVGARPTTRYAGTSASTSLTLSTTRMTCELATYTVNVIETPVLVQVLVHVDKSWLPPVGQWWTDFRAPTACVNAAKPTTLTASLTSELGRRIVVDSVTGASVKGQ